MNSSKTALLLMNAHAFEERNIPFLCIKPSIDNRDGDNIIKSRIGLSRECVSFDSTHNLFKFIEEYCMNVQLAGFDKPKWILVDECQFLSKEQVDQLGDIVDKLDINVMCYGLRSDFMTNSFEGSKRLMEIADDIEELKASCGCGRKAIFNARIDEFGNVVSDGEQIEIGGNERYISLCRKCYNEITRKDTKDSNDDNDDDIDILLNGI